jgi:GNAT superfamily N-acetyltransferase
LADTTRPAVRAARPEDAPELARLSTQLGYPMTASDAERQLASIAGHPDHALLVAASPDALAGWMQVSLTRIFESPVTAEIAGLVVDEARRGSGIGASLVAAAADWARARGCRALRVRTNVIRERALRFYEREGFGRVKQQNVLERPL